MTVAFQMKVIVTDLKERGAGTKEDPYRRIVQYWTLDGDLLAEVDPQKCDDKYLVYNPTHKPIAEHNKE